MTKICIGHHSVEVEVPRPATMSDRDYQWALLSAANTKLGAQLRQENLFNSTLQTEAAQTADRALQWLVGSHRSIPPEASLQPLLEARVARRKQRNRDRNHKHK